MSEPTERLHRTRTPSGRARAAAILALVGLAVTVSACSLDRDEPATVTLPEHNTTTTLPTDSRVPGTTQADAPEPLPIAWKLQVGGPGDDRLLAVTGHQAAVVAVGSTSGTTAGAPGTTTDGIDGPSDALATVVTTEGEIVAASGSGSPGADSATGVSANDEAVLACGTTDGAFGSTPAGAQDAWCGALDEDGATGTVHQLGGPDAEQVTGAALAAQDPTGYVSGTASGLLPGAQDPSGRGLGGGDALAVQTDALGRPVWARQFGTSLEDGALGVTTTQGADGIFVGYTDGDLEGPSNGGRDGWISRFDTSGNQRWITQVGSTGTDTFSAVAAMGEARRGTEQFVAAGTTDGDFDGAGPATAAGGTDAVVASFATDGALLWSTQFGSAGAESVSGVVADGSTIYVTGTTDGEFGDLIEDGGDGGGVDLFLAALDAGTGEVLWSSRLGTDGEDRSHGLATTEDGLLVVVGTTSGQFAETPPNGGVDGILVAFPLASSGGGAASSV